MDAAVHGSNITCNLNASDSDASCVRECKKNGMPHADLLIFFLIFFSYVGTTTGLVEPNVDLNCYKSTIIMQKKYWGSSYGISTKYEGFTSSCCPFYLFYLVCKMTAIKTL